MGGRALIEGDSTLQLLAEVSIAFTGFSGVVGVFGGGSALSEPERAFRLRMLIRGSLSAFFGSLLPLVLAEFALLTPWVWSLACPVLAALLVLSTLTVHRETRALASADDYSRPWFAPVIYLANSILAIALLGAAVSLVPAHGLYLAAVVWFLVLSSLHFTMLVIKTRRGSAV